MAAFRAVAMLVALLVLTGGCRTITGRTAGEWLDDRTITAKVKARLAGLDASTLTRVNVDTYDRIVYLSGVVDDEALKEQAVATARSVDAVRQVVANLHVGAKARERTGEAGVAAASPVTSSLAAGEMVSPASLLERLHGIARIEPRTRGDQPGRFAAFDTRGRLVATVYTVSMRELATAGLEDLRAEGARIDHVSIYPVAAHPDVPDPHYHVVLWHVTAREARALR
jgi:hypothetical protein